MSITDASTERTYGPVAASAKEQWFQLPAALRRDIGSEFSVPEPEFLRNVCLDEADRRSLVSTYASEAAEFGFFAGVLEALQVGSDAAASLCCKRRAAVHPSLQWLTVRKQQRVFLPTPPSVDSLEWLSMHSGAHLRSRRGLAKGSANNRAEAERTSLERWQRKLATILIDSQAPALVGSSDQNILQRAMRLAGSARSSTLKKHVQMWHRYRKWLVAAYQQQWPTSAAMVLDLFEELAAQPCGKTVPDAFCVTLQFMEKVAGVALDSRVGKHTAVMRTVQQLTTQLEDGAPPTKKAS